MRSIRRAIALALLAALSSGCASTHLPPISAAGASFRPTGDELELWERARDEEEKLLGQATLYQDAGLEAYLERLAARLTSPGFAANSQVRPRVRVVADPTLNAFAYPHGSLYLHTGMLAAAANEAQLATVLGHELAHVEYRHLLRHERAARNREIGLTIAAVAMGVALAVVAGDEYAKGDWGEGLALEVLSNLIVTLGLQLAYVAAVNGYGRELEAEADERGLARLAAAGYDVGEAPKLYSALLADSRGGGKLENFFFGSHPRLKERVAKAQSFADGRRKVAPSPVSASPAAASAEFEERLRPVVRDDAALNLALGRLDLAERQLLRVRVAYAEDAKTHYLWGRLAAARAAEASDAAAARGRRAEARASFERALALAPTRPEPHRELGLLLIDEQERPAACAALARYLDLAPDAPDAESIAARLTQLENDDSRCGNAKFRRDP